MDSHAKTAASDCDDSSLIGYVVVVAVDVARHAAKSYAIGSSRRSDYALASLAVISDFVYANCFRWLGQHELFSVGLLGFSFVSGIINA